MVGVHADHHNVLWRGRFDGQVPIFTVISLIFEFYKLIRVWELLA